MTVAEACGCCSGVSERTPLEVANRPGLSAIAYRVGVHSDFLASMIAGLTDADRPRLAALGTRDRDDFTIALLDAWAVTADVLAFYGERLQQESYLRTARDRISLQELGRLIGYQLRPGVAAETYLAFALEPPPDVPAAATLDPGSAPPAPPTALALEKGLRVQSIPGPGEQPQTFETVEEVEARPQWNAMPAFMTRPAPGVGATHAYLQGVGLNLKPGDAFLLTTPSAPATHWALRVLTAVDPDAERDRTLVSWSGAVPSLGQYLPPNDPPQAFVLRQRLNVFGSNAPFWRGMSKDFRKDYDNGTHEFAKEWPRFWITAPTNPDSVDLDGSHPEVVEGSFVVLARANLLELWRVETVTELSRAEFALSGKVTRLKLEGGENYDSFHGHVRTTTVFGASEELLLAEAPETSDIAGAHLDVDADIEDLLAMVPGRRVIVRGTTTDGGEQAEAGVVSEVLEVAGGSRIVLESDLSADYQRETVVVHGNVALATHGETVQQLLGSGRARDPFQRFALAHDPLTYVQSTTGTSGAEAELDVRVNDVHWDEVPTLYGAGPRDRVYAVRTDEAGKTYVQFGDGERGSRLPTGSNNVRAEYRKGLGAGGNVKASALAQLLDRPLGVKGVSNPAAASGGVDPEAEEAARGSIPLGVRTLGRTVSLLDYEDFARAFTGVTKANAAVLALQAGRTIVVTVAFEGGDRLEDLEDTLRAHGDPRVEVMVLAGTTASFRLALKVAVDPAYETDAVLAGVEAALRAAYAFEARGFVEPVFRSELVAVAHGVAGVLAVDVDRLYVGTTTGLAERLLAQQPAVGPGGTAIPAGVLVLDEAPLDWLEAIT